MIEVFDGKRCRSAALHERVQKVFQTLGNFDAGLPDVPSVNGPKSPKVSSTTTYRIESRLPNIEVRIPHSLAKKESRYFTLKYSPNSSFHLTDFISTQVILCTKTFNKFTKLFAFLIAALSNFKGGNR